MLQPSSNDLSLPSLVPLTAQVIPNHEVTSYSQGKLKIAVPDCHFPFHSREGIAWALDVIGTLKPEAVIQMADLYDMYSHSRYPRSLNLMTPNQEIDAGRAYAEWFWNQVKKVSPNSKCYQLGDGNHDNRANKRAYAFYAAASRWVEDATRELLTFKGVELVYGEREHLELDGVAYVHGWGKPGDHMKAMSMPTVIGHVHTGWCIHASDGRWEMGTGFMGDRNSSVFSYSGKKRADRSTLGLGLIDSSGPRFVPKPVAALAPPRVALP